MLNKNFGFVTLLCLFSTTAAYAADEGRQILWCANRTHQTLEVREIQDDSSVRTLVRYADANETHEQTVLAMAQELVHDELTSSLQLIVLQGGANFSINAEWSPAGSSAVVDLEFADGFKTGSIRDMSCTR